MLALVDRADYQRVVAAGPWHARLHGLTVYARAHHIDMHRFILGLKPGDSGVDHRDGSGLNNQRANLRLATQSQNGGNRSKGTPKSSAFKGVSWFSRSGCWRAQIQVHGERRHLGYFGDEVDAARAYDAAALVAFGEFAKVNVAEAV